MTVVPNPDLSGFLEEIDGIDEKFRDLLERTETRAEEHEVMSDWMAARHEAESRMVELIQIRV
jgi:hypothetical protein